MVDQGFLKKHGKTIAILGGLAVAAYLAYRFFGSTLQNGTAGAGGGSSPGVYQPGGGSPAQQSAIGVRPTVGLNGLPVNQPPGSGPGGSLTLADVQNALTSASGLQSGNPVQTPIFNYLNANSQTLLGIPSTGQSYTQALNNLFPQEFNTSALPQQQTSRLISNAINPLTAAIATITGRVGGGYIPTSLASNVAF